MSGHSGAPCTGSPPNNPHRKHASPMLSCNVLEGQIAPALPDNKTLSDILYACRLGFTVPKGKEQQFSELVDPTDKYVTKAKAAILAWAKAEMLGIIGEDYPADDLSDGKHTLHLIPAGKNELKAELRQLVIDRLGGEQ